MSCSPERVGSRYQTLGDDGFENRRELQTHLLLLVGREDRDDPVDGLGRIQGVERAHDQVAGLGRRQGGLDRLEVAHLADEDDVWILPEGGSQRVREAVGIHTNFALIHDRTPVPDEKLDWVLDRHDVTCPIGVDLLDHRGERGRLARPGGPRHQDQPQVLMGNPLDHLRQM